MDQDKAESPKKNLTHSVATLKSLVKHKNNLYQNEATYYCESFWSHQMGRQSFVQYGPLTQNLILEAETHLQMIHQFPKCVVTSILSRQKIGTRS